MVNNSQEVLNSTFFALADPTRRAILEHLAKGDTHVSGLPNPSDVSAPAISRHLRVLEEAGLIHRGKDGRLRRCCLNPQPLHDALEWISAYRRFWEKRLDALGEFLAQQEKESSTWPAKPSPKTPRSFSSGRTKPNGKKSSGPGRTHKH